MVLTNVTRIPFKFPRHVRLLKNHEFQAVFQKTRCRSSDNKLTVLATHNGLDHARLGLAIGKRAIKTAVGRNRLKRLVRESFRQHQQQLSGLDIVVLGRENAAHSCNTEILESLDTHWQVVAKQCAHS